MSCDHYRRSSSKAFVQSKGTKGSLTSLGYKDVSSPIESQKLLISKIKSFWHTTAAPVLQDIWFRSYYLSLDGKRLGWITAMYRFSSNHNWSYVKLSIKARTLSTVDISTSSPLANFNSHHPHTSPPGSSYIRTHTVSILTLRYTRLRRQDTLPNNSSNPSVFWVMPPEYQYQAPSAMDREYFLGLVREYARMHGTEMAHEIVLDREMKRL